MFQDDKLYWCVCMSPGQCYNKNTVPPSRYCMRFVIFVKLTNSLTMGYISNSANLHSKYILLLSDLCTCIHVKKKMASQRKT